MLRRHLYLLKIFISLLAWALCFISIAAADSAKCSLAPELIKIKQDSCKGFMKAAHCENFKPSEYLKTCSEDEIIHQALGDEESLLHSCHVGAIDVTADFFMSIDQLFTYVTKSIKGKAYLLQACDVHCKRRMSIGVPEFANLKDSDLQKINAAYIDEKVRVYEGDKMRFSQLEMARKFDPIRDPRVLAEGDRRQSNSSSSRTSDQQIMESLLRLVRAAIEKEFKRPQCYQAKFYPEMFCYGLFFIFDPVVSAGLVIKSPRLAMILAENLSLPEDLRLGKKMSAAKSGLARDDIEREVFIELNLENKFATAEENKRWIEAVESESLPPGSRVLDFENSVLQKLNNTTKDKNLVTSMTNKHKEILRSKIDKLARKYQDKMEFVPYSDFKAQRWLIKTKPPLTELPPQVQTELANIFKDVNLEFDSQLKLNGIIRKSDHAEDWFRGGMGSTADEANIAVRMSREMKSNELRMFDGPEMQENLKIYHQWAEQKRQEVAHDFAGTGLLEKTSGKVEIPSEVVFDAIRKNPSNEALREVLVKKYSGTAFTENKNISSISIDSSEREKMSAFLSDDKLNHLRDYAELANQFSPGLHAVERRVASIQEAELGGMTADFAGVGARNLRATAEALAHSSNVKEAIQMSRQGEKQVTQAFNREKEEFESVVGKYMHSTVSSGDDFAATAGARLSLDSKQKMLSEIAALKNPAGKRISFIGEGVLPLERNQLAAHGEAIEKNLRSELNGKISAEKLKQVVFATDMKGQRLGQGSVQLLIGESSSVGLTTAERKTIQKCFKQAVQEFNATSDEALASKAYRAD